MKPPAFLKTVLDILLILLIIGVALPFVFSIYHFSTSDEMLPVTINGQEIRRFNPTTYSIIFLSFLAKLIFLYIILRFRKLVRLFYYETLFTPAQVREVKRIGIFTIISAALNAVPVFVYKTFLEESPRRVSFAPGGFDSFWFILALGLFFIYLGNVFSNAQNLKEENDLTI